MPKQASASDGAPSCGIGYACTVSGPANPPKRGGAPFGAGARDGGDRPASPMSWAGSMWYKAESLKSFGPAWFVQTVGENWAGGARRRHPFINYCLPRNTSGIDVTQRRRTADCGCKNRFQIQPSGASRPAHRRTVGRIHARHLMVGTIRRRVAELGLEISDIRRQSAA